MLCRHCGNQNGGGMWPLLPISMFTFMPCQLAALGCPWHVVSRVCCERLCLRVNCMHVMQCMCWGSGMKVQRPFLHACAHPGVVASTYVFSIIHQLLVSQQAQQYCRAWLPFVREQ